MRLPDSRFTRAFPRALVTIFLAAGLAACGGSGNSGLTLAAAPPVARSGPQADYPVTVGAPYAVAGTQYTPVDVLNYDEVGYLAAADGLMGYTGAHHTLPFPSYVEVTSLDTGRTVLVRLEQRGPMASNHLVALSPAAMAQLGATPETAVRVRRVNPPEEHRALLRSGGSAPLRMDTPMSLVNVLRRQLPSTGSASLRADAGPPRPIETVAVEASTATPVAVADAASAELPPVEEPAAVAVAVAPAPAADRTPVSAIPALPPLRPLPPVAASEPQEDSFAAAFEEQQQALATVESTPPAAPAPAPDPAPAAQGSFVVQAAAFSNPDNARRAANVLDGEVTQSGNWYRVRTGPFATRGEAEASLANIRRAGYSDARILTSG